MLSNEQLNQIKAIASLRHGVKESKEEFMTLFCDKLIEIGKKLTPSLIRWSGTMYDCFYNRYKIDSDINMEYVVELIIKDNMEEV